MENHFDLSPSTRARVKLTLGASCIAAVATFFPWANVSYLGDQAHNGGFDLSVMHEWIRSWPTDGVVGAGLSAFRLLGLAFTYRDGLPALLLALGTAAYLVGVLGGDWKIDWSVVAKLGAVMTGFAVLEGVVIVSRLEAVLNRMALGLNLDVGLYVFGTASVAVMLTGWASAQAPPESSPVPSRMDARLAFRDQRASVGATEAVSSHRILGQYLAPPQSSSKRSISASNQSRPAKRAGRMMPCRSCRETGFVGGRVTDSADLCPDCNGFGQVAV